MSASALRRGDDFDYECSRTSHRLQKARAILAVMNVKPTVEHSDCERVEFGRPKHACDYRCKTSWPVWATAEMFEAAWNAACLAITAEGRYNRMSAGKA